MTKETSASELEESQQEEGMDTQEAAQVDEDIIGEDKPWYLQIEPHAQHHNPLLERQKVPDLPLNAPRLLQPIMEHVLYDLGLDDLKLLDLRKIDPPPALGANLLMLIATARSEKHLHVSADSLRKWMKSEHKTVVHTDGLIGRGEVKLRLKRKARRARILSRVGSVDSSSPDDGLRSAWVCATIENLGEDLAAEETINQQDDYVGFGSALTSTRLVIQMLTRERRDELGLEELWGDLIWRHGRKEAKIVAALESVLVTAEAPTNSSVNGQTLSLISNPSGLSSQYNVNTQQIRQVHSSSCKLIAPQSISVDSKAANVGPSAPFLMTKGFGYHDKDLDLEAFLANASVEHEEKIQEQENVTQEQKVEQVNLARVRAHVNYVKSLPREEAHRNMGAGSLDIDSTPFLRSFYGCMPLFPSLEYLECHLALLCHGIISGHWGYRKADLAQIFKEAQSSLIFLSADVYQLVFETLLTPRQSPWKNGKPILSANSVVSAAAVLEDMSFRGHDIATESIRGLFEEAVARASSPLLPQRLDPASIASIRGLLDSHLGQQASPELEIRKLHACADVGSWDGVWSVWNGFAADLRPRPKEVYVAMFQRLAARGHQAEVLEALRALVPTMDREEPPVELDGDIADSIKECLRVANPTIDNQAAEDWESNDELYDLWRRCEMAKQEDNRFLREYDDD